jgi:hypothetical protein
MESKAKGDISLLIDGKAREVAQAQTYPRII